MFTATLVAALVAAGVATAKAIGKGVQAKRQRESREKEQKRHLSAAEQVSQQTERYRGQYREKQMVGMQHQFEQMQPLQDAMMRAYGGTAGYQAPDMSWLMNPPETRANVRNEPERKVKAKKATASTAARDPKAYTGPGHAAPQQGPR
ncbi:MAG: hypothetical protein V3W41_13050 [Planctomycetota bacterium]